MRLTQLQARVTTLPATLMPNLTTTIQRSNNSICSNLPSSPKPNHDHLIMSKIIISPKGQPTPDSDSSVESRVVEFKFGLTVAATKEIGKMTKPMAEALFSTPTVTFTPASGNMTKPTATASMNMLTGPCTSVTGLKTSSTERVLKLGLTALAMKESTRTERKMDKERLPLQMVVSTRDSSYRMKSLARGRTTGQTRKLTAVTGFVTKCTGREFCSGQMVSCMKEISRMIREKVEASLLGKTEGFMMVSGKMGSRMVRGSS